MNKDEIEQHFAELAAENAALKARLAALEAKTAAPKEATRPAPKPIEEGVITTFPRLYPIQMPSPSELAMMFNIVAKACPRVVPVFSGRAAETDRRELYTGFVAAFEFVACCRRASKLDERGARFWASECECWHAARKTPADVRLAKLVMAEILATTSLPRSRQMPAPSPVRITIG